VVVSTVSVIAWSRSRRVDRQRFEVAAGGVLMVADTLPASTYTSSLGAAR
jgi:hypothetical protein